MTKRRDLEGLGQLRSRIRSAKDTSLVSLSSKGMATVKSVLAHSKSDKQTVAYHTAIQRYENLNTSLQKLNESIEFLGRAQGDLKREWETFVAIDSGSVRGALFDLLSCCESLDKESVFTRANSESKNLDMIMKEIKKVEDSGHKSCSGLAKLSGELEQSLRTLDSILGNNVYSGEEFDDYSKFYTELEELGEKIKRLKESLQFLEDGYTRDEWKHFIERDVKRLKEAIKTSYGSSMRLVGSIAQ